MKKVTLIIPDEFDKMLSIVVVGNARTGGVEYATRVANLLSTWHRPSVGGVKHFECHRVLLTCLYFVCDVEAKGVVTAIV